MSHNEWIAFFVFYAFTFLVCAYAAFKQRQLIKNGTAKVEPPTAPDEESYVHNGYNKITWMPASLFFAGIIGPFFVPLFFIVRRVGMFINWMNNPKTEEFTEFTEVH